MSMPASVLIGGVRWRLLTLTKRNISKYAPQYLEDDRWEMLLGLTCFESHVILLKSKVSAQKKQVVLMHELIHAVAYENAHQQTLSDLAVDEECVHLLCNELTSALKQIGILKETFYGNSKDGTKP